MTQWADKIGHLQIADNPHRGEPGTGEIITNISLR